MSAMRGCPDSAHPASSDAAMTSGASFLSMVPPRARRMQREGRAKSPTCDGIRRCQRLPELAHPVDLARPIHASSKDVPAKSWEKRLVRTRCTREASVAGDAVTCEQDAALAASEQPFPDGPR